MDSLNTNNGAENGQEPKLCINCKHIGTNNSGDWEKYRCFAPQNPSQVNLITGDKIYSQPYCSYFRAKGSAFSGISCTEAGLWYEAKPAPPVSGSWEEVTPAQLAARVQAAKAAKTKANPGTDLLKELGI